MIAFRVQVKFFLENPDAVDIAEFMGVFQRWIQQQVLGAGLLIDVADYSHVFDGPGIILIGHESDFAFEKREGRAGLLYTRKRQLDPDLPTQLRTSLRHALAACQLLESDTTFQPALKFRPNEVEIRFADRLQTPNQPETFDRVKDDLQAVLSELYGGSPVEFVPVQQDARNLFTVQVNSASPLGLADLLQNLQTVVSE